jgi:hypothetical protein
LEIQILEIDERLRPFANRAVDTNDPNWMTLLAQCPHPLDDAGVRSATESLLEGLIDEYQTCAEDLRRAIRGLFVKYSAFSWAATLPVAPTTDQHFRQHLVLFSMIDQGKDPRDAILALQDLCKQATAAGVNTRPILRQVAQLSSDENKYGWRSTRKRLLDAAA